MFKAWLFGVGILFVLAEFSIWLRQFMLPLPIYILAGALLAIASNYDSGLMTLFRQQDGVSSQRTIIQTATLVNSTAALTAKVTDSGQLPENSSSNEQL